MKHTLVRACLVCFLIVTLACTALASCGATCEHTYGDPTTLTAATCTEKGSQTRTCTLCGDIKTEDIPALGHDGHATCSVCQKEIVRVDQLTPAIPEQAEGIKLVIEDMTLTESYEGEGDVVTVVNAQLHLYPTAEGVFAYGDIQMDEGAGYKMEMDVFFDGNAILMEMTYHFGEESYTEQMRLHPQNLVQALTSDPSRLFGAQFGEAMQQTMYVIDTYLKPLFGGTDAPPTDTVLPEDIAPVIEGMLKESMQQALDTFFRIQSVEGGTDVILDLSVLHEWNTEMSEATLVTLINKLAADGAYQEMIAAIPALLELSVEDMIAYLEQSTGMEILELAATAEQIIAVYMGEEFSFEAFLGAPLETMLTNEAFLATTVTDFILQAMADSETGDMPTKEQLLAMIAQVTTKLETTKIYDLISNNTGASIKESIDAAIDEMEAAMKYTIHLDKDGKYAGMSYDMSIDGSSVKYDMTATDGGFGFAFDTKTVTSAMKGSMTLTFDPVQLSDKTDYEQLVSVMTTYEPTGSDLAAIFADNEFLAIDGGYVSSYDYIDEEEGYATLFATIVTENDIPFAMTLTENEDGSISGTLLFTGTEEYAEYIFAPGTQPDFATLEPETATSEFTVVMLYFEIPAAADA